MPSERSDDETPQAELWILRIEVPLRVPLRVPVKGFIRDL